MIINNAPREWLAALVEAICAECDINPAMIPTDEHLAAQYAVDAMREHYGVADPLPLGVGSPSTADGAEKEPTLADVLREVQEAADNAQSAASEARSAAEDLRELATILRRIADKKGINT